MLFLTRKVGETLMFTTPDHHTIKIKVTERNGERVHFGVDAPRLIKAVREELLTPGDAA